ncbi:hypothetical protein X975_06980, partial [Stegodyphus mimosarum]
MLYMNKNVLSIVFFKRIQVEIRSQHTIYIVSTFQNNNHSNTVSEQITKPMLKERANVTLVWMSVYLYSASTLTAQNRRPAPPS